MYGHHVHEAVIAARERVSGATVHVVDEEYDRGPIVLQRTVEVCPGRHAGDACREGAARSSTSCTLRRSGCYADRLLQHHQT